MARLLQKQNKVLSKPKQDYRLLPCRVHVILAIFVGLAMSLGVVSTWTFHTKTKAALAASSSKSRLQNDINEKTKASALSPTSSIQATNDDKDEDTSVTFHFIISSDCTSYQLWETLASFHGAEAIKQCGRFTWIVSGCLPEDQLSQGVGKGGAKSDVLTASVLQKHVNQHFPPHSDEDAKDCSRLVPELHFTPDYSDMSVYGGPYADGKTQRYFRNKVNGKTVRSSYQNTYVFNNKPNGLLHWARAHEHDIDNHPDEAIVLIDPDFLFLSRFHLARPDLSIVGGKGRKAAKDKDLVHPGQPAAASYGLGAQWLEFDLATICGKDSLCTKTTQGDVHKHYSAGPPYVIHRADVLPLAQRWAELVPPTYDEYPLLYAEMYAYSMAAAHLQLKHNLINGLFTGCMVGWPNPNRWGSKDLQEAEAKAVETSAKLYRTQLEAELAGKEQGLQGEEGAGTCFRGHTSLPPFLHYCNRYMIEATDEMKRVADHASVNYRFFAKRRVDHASVLACDKDNHNAKFQPFASMEKSEKMANGNPNWNTLAVCAIARTLNFAKRRGCHGRVR